MDPWFLLGEQRHTGVIAINTKPKEKNLVIPLGKRSDQENNVVDEQWPKPTQYKEPLSFKIFSHSAQNGSVEGLTVSPVEAKVT